jgi:hypothetical protein
MTGINQVLKLSWDIANKSKNNSNNDNDQATATTITDDKTRIQALALVNDCYKYIMDLTTNGVVITDAIKFVHTNKEKLSMSTNEENKESKELDYDENKEQLEGKQEKETENQEITNRVF